MKRLLFCALSALAAAAGFAEGEAPDFIIGATYEITGPEAGRTLTVLSGDGELVGTTPTNLQFIAINAGTSLKICSGKPFGMTPVVYLHGTLDLNGHSVTILRIDNLVDDKHRERSYGAKLVNTSPDAVTLVLNSGNYGYFYGAILEQPGAIDIRSCNYPISVFGPDGSSAITSFAAAGAKGHLFEYSIATLYKFVLYPQEGATKPLQVGEIGLTYRGKRVPGVTASATSKAEGSQFNYLVDDQASTVWTAAESGVQTVTNSVGFAKADGYRITPGAADCSPSGWDVYAFRDTVGWVLVDSRRNVTYSKRPQSSTTNILFAAEGRLGSPLGSRTAIDTWTNAPAMRVSTVDPLVVGDLTGSGKVLIENGSAIEPGDLSAFAGEFAAANGTAIDKQGQVRLTSRGGAEQAVPVKSAQNLAIVNGGEEPVSVLLDDSRSEHLFGRLADGERGKLGLVKRGGGERVIETEDASYTGATRVEEGTLTVARNRKLFDAVTARCLRFTPVKTVGADASYPWAANELQLLDADGEVIAWPSGTMATKPGNTASEHGTSKIQRFVDGNVKTRMLMPKFSGAAEGFAAITITLPSAVTFSGYRWYSTRENAADKNRTPVEWKLEFQDERGDWNACSYGDWPWSAADAAAAWQTGDKLDGIPRGDFKLRGAAQSDKSGLYTLPEEYIAAGGDRATHGKLKAQYFRFKVFETDSPETNASPNTFGWDLAEIGLMKDGKRVNWPDAVTLATYGGSVNGYNNSKKTNLCNNVIWEPNLATDNATREHCFLQEFPSYVVINAHEPLEFDTYSLIGTHATSIDFLSRLPRAWKLDISNTGGDWVTVDEVGDYRRGVDYVITNAYQEMGPFPVADKFPLLDRGAGDSLGDRSPVSIAEKATLRLATDYERFGTLSGAGTLDLCLGAVGEINVCAEGTFSGKVIGGGTLAVTGEGAQTFGDADLSGVRTLELNGGTVAGAASFGGEDATVAFNGGAIGATLSGIGALTVTGDVRIAFPRPLEEAMSMTLFAYDSIDADSKAALERATVVGLPRGYTLEVVVGEKGATATIRKNGFMIMVR